MALEKSGGILARVSGVFFALTEADTNDSCLLYTSTESYQENLEAAKKRAEI